MLNANRVAAEGTSAFVTRGIRLFRRLTRIGLASWAPKSRRRDGEQRPDGSVYCSSVLLSFCRAGLADRARTGRAELSSYINEDAETRDIADVDVGCLCRKLEWPVVGTGDTEPEPASERKGQRRQEWRRVVRLSARSSVSHKRVVICRRIHGCLRWGLWGGDGRGGAQGERLVVCSRECVCWSWKRCSASAVPGGTSNFQCWIVGCLVVESWSGHRESSCASVR